MSEEQEEQFTPSPEQRAQAVWALAGQPCPHNPAIEGYYLNVKTGAREPAVQGFPATRCNDCIRDTASTQQGERVLKELQEDRDHFKMVAEEWEGTANDLDRTLRRANARIFHLLDYIEKLEYELSQRGGDKQ